MLLNSTASSHDYRLWAIPTVAPVEAARIPVKPPPSLSSSRQCKAKLMEIRYLETVPTAAMKLSMPSTYSPVSSGRSEHMGCIVF